MHLHQHNYSIGVFLLCEMQETNNRLWIQVVCTNKYQYFSKLLPGHHRSKPLGITQKKQPISNQEQGATRTSRIQAKPLQNNLVQHVPVSRSMGSNGAAVLSRPDPSTHCSSSDSNQATLWFPPCTLGSLCTPLGPPISRSSRSRRCSCPVGDGPYRTRPHGSTSQPTISRLL